MMAPLATRSERGDGNSRLEHENNGENDDEHGEKDEDDGEDGELERNHEKLSAVRV